MAKPKRLGVRKASKPEYRVWSLVLPARPIEKGRPGPGLLAHVVTSKYGDHLPLYRLERIFPRHGIDIGRSTLSEWCGAVDLGSVAIPVSAFFAPAA